jgi:hypothetical protein
VLQELSRKPNNHLCHLVETFLLNDGSPCLAIEFLEGGALTDLIGSETPF